jgi:hypothetical protein
MSKDTFRGQIYEGIADFTGPNGHEDSARFVTIVPPDVDRHSDHAILAAPSFGQKGKAVDVAAMRLAQATGIPVTAYEHSYGANFTDSITQTPHLSLAIAQAVQAKQSKTPTPRIFKVNSASGIALPAMIAYSPELIDVGIFEQSDGLDNRERFTRDQLEELDQLPLHKRSEAAIAMPGGLRRGLSTAARFAANSLIQQPGMIADMVRGKDMAYVQSARGFAPEIFENLRLTPRVTRRLHLPRTILGDALLLAGNLEVTPELRAARELGIRIGVAHGSSDIVFPTERVRNTLEETPVNSAFFVPGGHTYPSSIQHVFKDQAVAETIRQFNKAAYPDDRNSPLA